MALHMLSLSRKPYKARLRALLGSAYLSSASAGFRLWARLCTSRHECLTMIQALQDLTGLYTFYFEILGRLLDGLLDLLCVPSHTHTVTSRLCWRMVLYHKMEVRYGQKRTLSDKICVAALESKE